ncbi:MAG: FMN-binding protein [Ignavibacteriales bacterium]|nr:FMN-binding protein [Ignavibacteriales bacterium]
MNLKKIVIIKIILVSILFAGELKDRTDAHLRKFFGEECAIDSKKYIIPKELKNEIENLTQQRFYTDFVFLYYIKKDDKINSYAVLDNVIGKVQPITFLVIYDSNFSISDFQIIKYREEHGGEVQNESWRNQFIGKRANSEFTINENIDGITGATISVKSLIKGINKTTLLIRSIVGNE